MARPLAPCGTYGAYQRHLKRKEPVDDACSAAPTAYRESRKAPLRSPAPELVPGPTVTCPVCLKPVPVEHPFDDVAERMARLRHVTESRSCRDALDDIRNRTRIPA